MNPSEAWRLLTAGSVWQACLNRAFGVEAGFEAIKPDDVRLAMQGLPERPYWFAMAALLGDGASLKRLYYREHIRITGYAARHGWPEPPLGSYLYRRIVSLALYETIAGEFCHTCNGRGYTIPRSRARALKRYLRIIEMHMRRHDEAHPAETQPCKRKRRLEKCRREKQAMLWAEDHGELRVRCRECRGSGRIRWTEGRRARLAGISRPTWYRQGWCDHYAVYREQVKRLESWAIAHVRRRLRQSVA